MQSPSITSTTSGSICRTGTRGKITKTFLWATGAPAACGEIFGIDLPWLLDAFGPVKHVYAEKDKLSGLEIDYPDSYFVTLRHENGTKGVLAADVVSPKAVRNFEVFGEGLHLFWEGNPQGAVRATTPETREKVLVDTYGSCGA